MVPRNYNNVTHSPSVSNVANAALKVPIKLLGACRPAVFVNVWNARKKIYSD